MNQEAIIRKKETKFIKDKLKEKKNLLVIGEKGVGKTTIIEQASEKSSKWIFKKLLSIDLVEVQNTKNLSYYLSFKGWNHLFLEKLCKNFIKIFSVSISLSVLMYSIVINFKSDWNYLFWIKVWLPLIPIILFLSMLFISWLINAFFNIFSKKWNFKIIHFHELNFINDKNKREELLKIIWKIKNIYKNNLLIFETDEKFDQELKYKFDLKEIHLKNINKWDLIDNLFEDLKKEIENIKIKQEHLKKLKDLTNKNKLLIQEIMNDLTYRTFYNLIKDFKDVYIFSKQEINLLDFLILKFLQLKNTKLYYEIMQEENYNALISRENYNLTIDEEKAKKNKIKKDYLLKEIKSTLPSYVTWYIEHHTLDNLISKKQKIYNSFFIPKYKSFYFSIFNYAYLEMELVEKFQNEPLTFLQEFNEFGLNEIEIFDFIEDQEIIEFLDFIEKQNSNELLNFFLSNNDFLKREIFFNLSIIIINSRKNKKLFFDSLSKKYKYYFFHCIYSYKFIFQQKELEEIEKNLIPFEINDMPKNLVLIRSNYKGKEIFNLQEYYKNAIKTKNKFLILLISQNSQFFMLQDFLSSSQKSFVLKCCDEFNKKMPKNKNLKIKKYDSQKKNE